jgi:hypothetical protein
LDIKAPSQIRDLAQCLLTYEATTGNASGSVETMTLRVYEKLRQSLGVFAGAATFYSLASRALVLARSEAPSLNTVQVTADGSLQGLEQSKPETNIDKDGTDEDQTDDEGVILIARLLGLLLVFLGEALTLRLLRDAWPDAAFDDCNSRNGRKP